MRKLLLFLAWCLPLIKADVVECENGDRYNGKVLLVDEQNVRIENDIAGVLTIPRAKVSTISFGTPKAPRIPAKAAATAGAAPLTNILSPAQPLTFDAKAIEQVQKELLGDASPEATQMFQEMVRGLMSGKLDLGDVRTKAQGTLDELKDLQKDLGDDDTAALLSSYASLLQNFINQAPAKPKAPAAAAPAPPEEKKE